MTLKGCEILFIAFGLLILFKKEIKKNMIRYLWMIFLTIEFYSKNMFGK